MYQAPKQNIFAVQSTRPSLDRHFNRAHPEHTSTDVHDRVVGRESPLSDLNYLGTTTVHPPNSSLILTLESRIQVLETETRANSERLEQQDARLRAMSSRVDRLESLLRPVPPPPAGPSYQPSTASYDHQGSHLGPASHSHQSIVHAGASLYGSSMFPTGLAADQSYSTISDTSFGSSFQG